MRHPVLQLNVRDIGRLLGAMVFLELMRHRGTCMYRTSSGSEIDFVTSRRADVGTTVSESVHDSATLNRAVLAARRAWQLSQKTLITLDERPCLREDIRQVYTDWLLNEDHGSSRY